MDQAAPDYKLFRTLLGGGGDKTGTFNKVFKEVRHKHTGENRKPAVSN
jgi:hypothetical protein